MMLLISFRFCHWALTWLFPFKTVQCASLKRSCKTRLKSFLLEGSNSFTVDFSDAKDLPPEYNLGAVRSRFPSRSWSIGEVRTVKLAQQPALKSKEGNEEAENKLGVTFACSLLEGWSVLRSQGRAAVCRLCAEMTYSWDFGWVATRKYRAKTYQR